MNIFQILNDDDAFTVLCLMAILTIVGSRMTEGHPSIRQWGRRLAAGAFLFFCFYAGCVLKPGYASDLLHIAFRGLFAAGMAQGMTWVTLPIAGFGLHLLTELRRTHVAAEEAEESRRRQEEHDRRAEENRTHHARQEAERAAGEREAAARKAEERRRRADARMRCLTLYDRHAIALAERFPRERLQEYFDGYMGDSSPADVVEERGRALAALIEQWVEQDKSREKKRFQSLGELAAFFQKQREEVEGLSYAQDIKESLVCNINVQEEQALRRFLS